MKTAILVDGGFYRKRAHLLFGDKSPEDRADELVKYCLRHVSKSDELYRIFYYDCMPSDKSIYHPLLQKSISLKKSDIYIWSTSFFDELKHKRKLALRMGECLESSIGYNIYPKTMKKLLRNEVNINDLSEHDFYLDIQQKGVDMRIGLDIASLSSKKLVDQIILISADSDFVPAAKYARREGIDFILDPMWNDIRDSLCEHIDGLETKVAKPPKNTIDTLYKNN